MKRVLMVFDRHEKARWEMQLIAEEMSALGQDFSVFTPERRITNFSCHTVYHFGVLDHPGDVHRYRGMNFNEVIFDEGSKFYQYDVEVLKQRVRYVE